MERSHEGLGMTSVDIAEQNHSQWDAAGSGVVVGSDSAESARKQTAVQISEQLPFINAAPLGPTRLHTAWTAVAIVRTRSADISSANGPAIHDRRSRKF